MSIALLAYVRPSPCLHLLRASLATCVLAVGLWLSPWSAAARDAPLRWPLAAPIICVAASLMGLRGLLRPANAYRLDISGIGQMRLAVYLSSEPGQAVAPPGAVALMADSALWPWLLVLRLRRLDEQGGTLCLLVLPDSVAPGGFRPLALACRACAAKIVY